MRDLTLVFERGRVLEPELVHLGAQGPDGVLELAGLVPARRPHRLDSFVPGGRHALQLLAEGQDRGLELTCLGAPGGDRGLHPVLPLVVHPPYPAPSMAQAKGRLSSKAFFDVLRTRTPKNASRVDREIEVRSIDDVTVVMVDSSGFSRKSHEYGIIQFLAVMTQCYDKIIPLLEKRSGVCLSRNADNIVALFDDPASAIRGAIDMQRWLLRRNAKLPDKEQYSVCIGINCGPVIRLKDNVYGDMVNIGAKVGEDLAAKDQILVTGAVADRVGGLFDIRYDRSVEIGKQLVALHEVRY